MEERTTYEQLRPEERVLIASMKLQGSSARAIARVLERPPSTISRELRRNRSADGYASHTAQALHAVRRTAARPAAKLDVASVAWGVVLTLLSWKWSPQQIAATLKRVYPDQPEHHVSHETIYTAIYAQPRGELRRQLIACLRHGRSTRMPRSRGTDRRGQIPEMVSIHVRPPEVNDRVMPGHWEGDFIKGAGNKSSVGVLVERTSRLVLLARMEDATAATALAGFTVKLNAIAAPMRQSLTYDQGKEMARHRRACGQHRRAGVLLRPAQPLAARYLREHQRVVAPVPAQGHRSVRVHAGRARRHRRQLEHQAARYAQLAHAARGLRTDAGQLSQAINLSSLTRVLHFGLETAGQFPWL